MKILYWAPSPGISLSQNGGAGTHMRGVIGAFRNAGCNVLSIIGGDIYNGSLSSPAGQDVRLQREGLFRKIIKSVTPLPLRLLIRDLRILRHKRYVMRESWNTILDFSPDIVYERASYLVSTGLKIAKTLRIPYALESDVNLVEFWKEEFGTALEWWGNKIEQKKHDNADVIFVMAEAAKEELVKKRHVSPDKIFVKGLGVDTRLFNTDKIRRDKIREKFNIQDEIVVGFVGVFRKYHKVDLLIQAAKILQEKGIKVNFLIIGYGNAMAIYRKFIKKNSINNMHFTGKIPYKNVPEYINAFHIAVIPGCASFMYPIKVLEYGALKKPVIVPRLKAFDELIKDEYNGLFFEPDSASCLARAIERLVNSPYKRKVYGARLYKEVLGNYTWDKIGEETLKIIAEVLNEKS